MKKTKEETMLDAEVTLTFVLDGICWQSDLEGMDDEDGGYFRELVEERLNSGEYEIGDGYILSKCHRIS